MPQRVYRVIIGFMRSNRVTYLRICQKCGLENQIRARMTTISYFVTECQECRTQLIIQPSQDRIKPELSQYSSLKESTK